MLAKDFCSVAQYNTVDQNIPKTYTNPRIEPKAKDQGCNNWVSFAYSPFRYVGTAWIMMGKLMAEVKGIKSWSFTDEVKSGNYNPINGIEFHAPVNADTPPFHRMPMMRPMITLTSEVKRPAHAIWFWVACGRHGQITSTATSWEIAMINESAVLMMAARLAVRAITPTASAKPPMHREGEGG